MKTSTLIVPLLIFLLAQSANAESAPASFAYILQADSFAKSKMAAVEQLAACGRDWIVLDAEFSSDTPWERADLAAIRSGKPGRKIVAYISIGEAEDLPSCPSSSLDTHLSAKLCFTPSRHSSARTSATAS